MGPWDGQRPRHGGVSHITVIAQKGICTARANPVACSAGLPEQAQAGRGRSPSSCAPAPTRPHLLRHWLIVGGRRPAALGHAQAVQVAVGQRHAAGGVAAQRAKRVVQQRLLRLGLRGEARGGRRTRGVVREGRGACRAGARASRQNGLGRIYLCETQRGRGVARPGPLPVGNPHQTLRMIFAPPT